LAPQGLGPFNPGGRLASYWVHRPMGNVNSVISREEMKAAGAKFEVVPSVF
jgi:hypothetical protein